MRHLAHLLLVLACGAVFAAEDPAALVAKLQPAAGWTATDPARTATSDTLFDLIDGGAELYQEYGVNRVVSWQLENAARSSIQVELYEMTDAPAAFGVWSLMQTGRYTRGEIGQGSIRTSYYIAFWNGPYFATVTGAQPDAITQAEVDRLAGALARELGSPSTTVWPCFRIPQDPHSVTAQKYFRGRIGLSNIKVPVVLDLFAPGEGVVEEYAEGVVVVLKFASETEARQHLAAAEEKVRQDSAWKDLRRETDGFSASTGDGRRLAASIHGACLSVSDRPERDPAAEISDTKAPRSYR